MAQGERGRGRAGMDMDLGAVLEDDVGVAGVGERVGDGQVVAPHHADVELPDHPLLGRRRHCAGVWVWWDRGSELRDKPRRRLRREGGMGSKTGGVVWCGHRWIGWRPAPGFIGGAASASWIISQPIIVAFLLMTGKAGYLVLGVLSCGLCGIDVLQR